MADWVSKPLLPGSTATRQPYASSYTLPGAPAPASPFVNNYQVNPQVAAQPVQPSSALPRPESFGAAPAATSQQPQQAPAQSPSGGAKPTTWVSPASSSTQYTNNYQPNPSVVGQPIQGSLPSSLVNNYGYNPTAPIGSPLRRYIPPPPPENPGTLRQPGAYEDWYEGHKGQYDQPTNVQGYYDRNSGKFENYEYDPFNTSQAYSDLQNKLGGTSYGTGVSRDVSAQLRNPLTGEAYYGQAGDMLGGPNLATDYANDTRGFFSDATDSKGLYDRLAPDMLMEGQGEFMARSELPGLNTVGAEFDYFRDPLRGKSYSEQLYESGNQGLNTYYDRESAKRQEALERRMAATGIFGSGETIKGMAEIEAELGAQQARDMASLAGQADQSFLGRTGMARDFAGASSREDLDRIGMGLEMDKGTRDRYGQLIDLAGQSDQTSLDRILGGSDVARSGDDSRINQADRLRMLGDSASGTELDRLRTRSDVALAGDQEERLRANDVFGAATDLDDLRLRGDQTELDYLTRGGDLASDADRTRLDWLNSGGDAADRAQQRFEQRERYGINDSLRYADALSGLYTGATNTANDEQTEMQGEAINLLMQREGLNYQQAMQRANEWASLGTLATQVMALKGQK